LSKKWVVVGVLGASLLCGVPVHAEPKELQYGFWQETYRGFVYRVDTKARLCFAQIWSADHAALAVVPCERLYERDEWKPILTWIERDQKAE